MTKLRGKIALILCFALSILMIFMLTSCDTDEKKPTPSQGLELELNTGTDTYTVVGIGTCTDTLIVIPSMHKGKAVTSIESKAFYNCTSLTSVTIPDSVTSIGGYAFNGCYSLTSVTIPDSVKRIGYEAFCGCHSLTIYCEAESKPSGWDSYWNDSNRPVVWDCKANGTTEEGLCWAQKSNDEIIIAGYTGTNPSVEIPSTINSLPVTSIGYGAFYECTSLTSIVIPDSVTSIGGYAFNGCYSLTSVTIPDSVKRMGSRAFNGCHSLTIYCEAKSKPSGWDSYWNDSNCPVIWGCKANGTTEEGLCWAQNSNDEIIIAGYTGTNPSVEIPSTINSLPVTSIGEGAFARCTSLTSATIPDSVTSIGYRAFYNCISLTSIEIPNSVTSIGEDAFALCASLTSVTIPDSVKTIGDRAFYYCTSLTSIEIPNSVTSIGNSVFDYCRLLTIYCEAERRPSGWDSSWNYSSRPVVWGHTHTYANGKCVCGAKQN